jgi:CDP-paratose 2-epimerase
MPGTVLITGGAGFIGCNLAAHYLEQGWTVRVFDNLSRTGVVKNLDWLRVHPGALEVFVEDVRSRAAVEKAVDGVDLICHLAGQVAVTHSVADPQNDFEVNAGGTMRVLEAARRSDRNPVIFYTSTNKVYGGLEGVKVVAAGRRCSSPELEKGVSEGQALDFHSPYGCSKGAADQYVRDYARLYGLRSVVFRMSCIYGTRQFGTEDQGWVAHFMIAAVLKRAVTIYGDGRQVRDILFITDLIRAFDLAWDRIEWTSGQIYNIGGGPQRTISLLELLARLHELTGYRLPVSYQHSRPGDQPYYVSCVDKADREFGWQPTVSVDSGLLQLYEWVWKNQGLFV